MQGTILSWHRYPSRLTFKRNKKNSLWSEFNLCGTAQIYSIYRKALYKLSGNNTEVQLKQSSLDVTTVYKVAIIMKEKSHKPKVKRQQEKIYQCLF